MHQQQYYAIDLVSWRLDDSKVELISETLEAAHRTIAPLVFGRRRRCNIEWAWLGNRSQFTRWTGNLNGAGDLIS